MYRNKHISLRCTTACFICRVTQKICYIMGYASKRMECIFKCVLQFLIISNTIEKRLCIRFVCLSVCVRSFVNILQTSLNLQILFISDIKWTILKMICMGLSLRSQKHTKVFRCISAYRGCEVFKVSCIIFILH